VKLESKSTNVAPSRRIDFSGAFTRDYRLVGDARSITRIVMATEMAPSNCEERDWNCDDIVIVILIVFGLWPPKKLNQKLDNNCRRAAFWAKIVGGKNLRLAREKPQSRNISRFFCSKLPSVYGQFLVAPQKFKLNEGTDYNLGLIKCFG